MYLFTFREVAEIENRYFRKTHILPSVFAIHPTKEQISKEEWDGIKQEAEARLETARAQFEKTTDQIMKELDKKKMSFSSPGAGEYISRRYRELDTPTVNLSAILSEVMKEKGFKIVGPQELTFQIPLTSREKETLDKLPLFEEGPFERINTSDALGKLERCGIETDDILFGLSKK